jgi:hypothetical protein
MACAAIATAPTLCCGGRTLETSPVCGLGEVSKDARSRKNGGNTPIPETGTARAINYLKTKCGSTFAWHRQGRGTPPGRPNNACFKHDPCRQFHRGRWPYNGNRAGQRAALPSQDTQRNGVPITGGKRAEAVPDARRN